MVIATIKFGKSPKTYDYLVRNMTVKTENPVYLHNGSELKYITGSSGWQPATVVGLKRVDELPKHVTAYLQIDDEKLEVVGVRIGEDLRRRIEIRAAAASATHTTPTVSDANGKVGTIIRSREIEPAPVEKSWFERWKKWWNNIKR